jgi:hypothetical protein
MTRIPGDDIRFLRKGEGDGEYDRVHQNHHQRFPRGDNYNTSKSHRRSSVCGEGRDRGDAAARGTGMRVPLCNGTSVVSKFQSKVRHLAMHRISHDACKISRQGRLGKTKETARISEGHSTYASDPIGRLSHSLSLVGGRDVRSAPRHEGTHGCGNELWPGHGTQLFLETRNNDKDLNGSRTGGSGRLPRIYLVGSIFHAGARI